MTTTAKKSTDDIAEIYRTHAPPYTETTPATIPELMALVLAGDEAAEITFGHLRHCKFLDLYLYLEDKLKPGVNVVAVAQEIVEDAFDYGRYADTYITGEVAAEYTISGQPLAVTV
jgi:hypothetical protein